MGQQYDPDKRQYIQNGGGFGNGNGQGYEDYWGQSRTPKAAEGQAERDAVNNALDASRRKAFSLEDTQEQRGQDAERIYREAGEAANKPTISDQDVSRMFGQVSDTSGNAFQQQAGDLRTMMGESGITGGSWTGGIAASMEAQRMNANRAGFTNVLLKKSAADAQDRFAQYDRQKDLAGMVNRDPSMFGSDFLQQMSGIRLAEEQIGSNERAANKSAKATESAGKSSMAGSIVSGLFGMAAGA